MTRLTLAGVDLAWKSEKNSSAIVTGLLDEVSLKVLDVFPQVRGLENVKSVLAGTEGLAGIAIDAPLIIPNEIGQRECEKQLSREYGSRGSACHPTNTNRYPGAASVDLAQALAKNGYEHMGDPERGRFQVECYPHPAIIEIFGLPYRHAYKKGRVSDKRNGQSKLGKYIRKLDSSRHLILQIEPRYAMHLDEEYIRDLRGKALKQNEDILDAMLCLYICGMYVRDFSNRIYGSKENGYIYVPQMKCI